MGLQMCTWVKQYGNERIEKLRLTRRQERSEEIGR